MPAVPTVGTHEHPVEATHCARVDSWQYGAAWQPMGKGNQTQPIVFGHADCVLIVGQSCTRGSVDPVSTHLPLDQLHGCRYVALSMAQSIELVAPQNVAGLQP